MKWLASELGAQTDDEFVFSVEDRYRSSLLCGARLGTFSLPVSLPLGFQMTLTDLQQLSASQNELVLPYVQAMKALELLESAGASLLGWEGWLRYPDRRLGHSPLHQGVDTSKLAPSEAYRLARDTICISQKEYESTSAMADVQLLFCITVSG